MKIAPRTTALLAGTALALGGCGTATTNSPASTTAASPSATPALPDGRSAAYLVSLDPASHTLTFDGIEFLTGDAGKAAFAKVHPSPAVGEDDIYSGYFIVDDDTTPQTLPLSPQAQILVFAKPGYDVNAPADQPLALADAPAWFASHTDASTHHLAQPFWLTVQGGQIVKLEQQNAPTGTGD